MGWFDPNSNGHHVYWPEKRIVTVERNVIFILATMSLEGESDNDESAAKTHIKPQIIT